jgi:hypothetical protein
MVYYKNGKLKKEKWEFIPPKNPLPSRRLNTCIFPTEYL